MYIYYSNFPNYAPGTDVLLSDEPIECRVFPSGDDLTMWDVQFYGADERPHTAPPEMAKAILAHIEANDVSAWGDITAQARVNPTLGEAA